VETAFIPIFHTARFLGLKEQYGFSPIQVYCAADDAVLFERFQARVACGERHPGHVDHLATHEQFAAASKKGKYGILEIGGPLLQIDITDWTKVDHRALAQAVRSILVV
jgi:hypothetical protein